MVLNQFILSLHQIRGNFSIVGIAPPIEPRSAGFSSPGGRTMFFLRGKAEPLQTKCQGDQGSSCDDRMSRFIAFRNTGFLKLFDFRVMNDVERLIARLRQFRLFAEDEQKCSTEIVRGDGIAGNEILETRMHRVSALPDCK